MGLNLGYPLPAQEFRVVATWATSAGRLGPIPKNTSYFALPGKLEGRVSFQKSLIVEFTVLDNLKKKN